MLTEILSEVLDGRRPPEALGSAEPAGERDELLTVLTLHDLSLAPLPSLGARVAWQGQPDVAALRWRLDARLEERLDELVAGDELAADPAVDAVAAMRRLAARDRCPAVYEWLARDATWPELVRFLAIEGGPDAMFDDLVAICQVGLTGLAKVTLAENYWDEMGAGRLADVHTNLHDDLVAAIDMPRLARHELPLTALRRAAIGGFLATNRRLQPEMLGALGLLELQAGPRCRQVVRALERLAAPAGAVPFYEVHAGVDPRHGKEWLERVIVPVVADQPSWAPHIVRGALWRSSANRQLFELLADERVTLLAA